jgi:type I restriction enzyme R subunit
MQTIARANRVFPDKNNGLIVDYVGVFRNLQAALSIYAAPTGDDEDAMPVKDKAELLAWLGAAVDNATSFCGSVGVDLDSMVGATGLDMVAKGEDAVEQLLVDDDTKARFLNHARLVDRLFKAILPDPEANEFGPTRALLRYLADAISSKKVTVDVSEVLARVEQLLDESLAANAYVIHETDPESLLGNQIDLNEIDWEAVAQEFATGKQRTEAAKLRAAVAAKVDALARLNPTRQDWVERFQQLIDDYNAGSANLEQFFQQLIDFTKALNEEERRSLAENLDEEQLAIYDLLMRPAPDLSEPERKQVKKVAESLRELLKREKLVLNWRKEQQSRAAVRLAVEMKLDELPEKYDSDLFQQKCEVVYLHVFDSYWDDGRSIYSTSQLAG